MLYDMPVPTGAVTVIVPVETVQPGWVNVTVGVEGVGGWAFSVTLVPDEMHPSKFFAVTM